MTRRSLAWLLALGLVTPVVAAPQKAEEKKDEKKDEKGRKGTVTGIVTAKGDNWVEVKADGEEKARRYTPPWKGGNPSQGGAFDKEVVGKIKETPLQSRVTLDWSFDERPRVEKIEVLKKGEPKKDEKKPEKK